MELEKLDIPDRLVFFRKLRGMTQEDVSCVAGLNNSLYRKYEAGFTHPKYEQLKNIAEKAFNISITTFLECNIRSYGDIINLLMNIDDNTKIKWNAEKDKDGTIIPASISLSFQDKRLNVLLAQYLKLKAVGKRKHPCGDAYDALSDQFVVDKFQLAMDDHLIMD